MAAAARGEPALSFRESKMQPGLSVPLPIQRRAEKGPPTHGNTGNDILDSLTETEHKTLSAHFRDTNLVAGETMFEPGMQLRRMYFPTSGMISLMMDTEDGYTSEVAMVGSEGLLDTSVYLAHSNPGYRALVQLGGHAIAISADVVRNEFAQSDNFKRLLLAYSNHLIQHLAQTSLCKGRHTLGEQFALHLFAMSYYVNNAPIKLTQERMAEILGVRREGVSFIASQLKADRVIDYTRGTIRILDRAALAAASCDCHKHFVQVFTQQNA